MKILLLNILEIICIFLKNYYIGKDGILNYFVFLFFRGRFRRFLEVVSKSILKLNDLFY